MNNQKLAHVPTEFANLPIPNGQHADSSAEAGNNVTPPYTLKALRNLSPFWHDRLIEAGMVVSMVCYYLIGNSNIGNGWLFHLNPLYSFPFLLIFIALCWYRLSFAVALLPLTLPYYLLQKPVSSHYEFGLAEITLLVCLGVALLQLLYHQINWQYWLSWRDLRAYVGPFILPILVFLIAALVATAFALNRHTALRSFREVVVEPIIYVLLVIICLRSRQDLMRLLVAVLATGSIIALLGYAQLLFFAHYLKPDASGGVRISAVYSGANDIGVLFDYILPIALALLLIGTWRGPAFLRSWGVRIGVTVLCLLLLFTLYLSQSGGGEAAIAVAFLFIGAFVLRSRKALLLFAAVLVLAAAGVALVFHRQIIDLIFAHHSNAKGISTVMRRIYLWESALHMIRDHPILGIGPDNWLCYYSRNNLCTLPAPHYWILQDPVTHAATGMRDEPNLAQPHNDILNIWLYMGLFGLLAFLALIALFFWTFVRVLSRLRFAPVEDQNYLRWITVGVGAAMLAALVQAMVDSVFLGQDTSFLFWMLISTMLLLQFHARSTWRGKQSSNIKS